MDFCVYDHDDIMASDISYMEGASTANQRIEYWWSFLQRECTEYWVLQSLNINQKIVVGSLSNLNEKSSTQTNRRSFHEVTYCSTYLFSMNVSYVNIQKVFNDAFSFCQYQVLKRLGCLVTVMSFSKNWSKLEFFVFTKLRTACDTIRCSMFFSFYEVTQTFLRTFWFHPGPLYDGFKYNTYIHRCILGKT